MEFPYDYRLVLGIVKFGVMLSQVMEKQNWKQESNKAEWDWVSYKIYVNM